MDEIQDVIPLLCMNGLSTRKVKKSISKLLGNKGLSHQNVLRISSKIVDEFNAYLLQVSLPALEEDKDY